MHPNSHEEMRRIIHDRYVGDSKCGRVIDFGSQDVNGSYRDIFPDASWQYVGVDVTQGRNVDVVMPGEFDTGLLDCSADLVISGQCIEHCSNPFRLVEEMYRVCANHGECILIAPYSHKEHRYPIDCWRFLPDGMECLFKNAGFTLIRSYIKEADCIGIARKEA